MADEVSAGGNFEGNTRPLLQNRWDVDYVRLTLEDDSPRFVSSYTV